MGPQSAKSYPGQRVVKPTGPEAQRAKQEIDYGRRGVAGHVFGAFQPAMGDALTAAYVGRTTANWVDFLGKVEALIDPSVERGYAVMDNLNTPSATGVVSFALAHPRWEFVFQPKYAAYLNLSEPWWKILRSFGSQRAPLRDLGAERRGRPARHRVLEPAQAPLHLGPQTAAPHLAPPRGRRRAKVRNNLADAPLNSSF